MSSQIEDIIKLPNRKLIVSTNDIDLNLLSDNIVFILMVEESRGSAGGRGGGSGHRRITKIWGFRIENRNIYPYFETDDEKIIEQFEIPYSAVAMDIKLSHNQNYVIQGVSDTDLIKSYMQIVSKEKK
ncbi:MAG: hypothetical protein DA328_02270 [Nitrososphaeraceae archaeon]|nr:hypothetical protein [Nitrososphaeraceae archaeon]